MRAILKVMKTVRMAVRTQGRTAKMGQILMRIIRRTEDQTVRTAETPTAVP
jgi:hypothetical protein